MRNKKGLTLVELIIAIGIFSLVITLAGTFLYTGLKNYNVISEILVDQYSTRQVMFDITSNLRDVDFADISIAENNNSITIDNTTFSFNSEAQTITKTVDESSYVIANFIDDFSVTLSDVTVNYSISSENDDANLESSVTFNDFTRPSPS